MTGYLQTVIEQARPYEGAVPVLVDLLGDVGSEEILDLASGAGGPWRRLVHELSLRRGGPVSVTLSDIRPNEVAAARLSSTTGLRYLDESLSALDVPPGLGRVRTMFTGLHHFDPTAVRAILGAAQRDRVGFAAFEATQRSWRGLLVTLLIPVLVLLLMPRVRPRRIAPLLLTYLPPLLPILIWWDGLASTLKTYSAEELRALVSELERPGYSWEVVELSTTRAPIPMLQVIGRPCAVSDRPQTDRGLPGSRPRH